MCLHINRSVISINKKAIIRMDTMWVYYVGNNFTLFWCCMASLKKNRIQKSICNNLGSNLKWFSLLEGSSNVCPFGCKEISGYRHDNNVIKILPHKPTMKYWIGLWSNVTDMTTISLNNTTQTNNEILKVMMRKPQTLKQGNWLQN
jgi:hypothetical protein